MLNPIWLKTFKTLVDVGHFTRTADALNMTQPGVSQHISKLEDACGYPLIKRFNKQFELTIYGRKVYDFAEKRMLEEVELLKDLGFDEPFKGRCTIGCSGTLAWLLYPQLLTIQQSHPELSLEMEAAPNNRILEQVYQGVMDVGLVTKPPSSKYFKSEVVGGEYLAIVVPSSADDQLPLNELLQSLGVIRHPDLEHYFLSYIANSPSLNLKEIDIDRFPTRSYINQIHQILIPIAKGIGCTVVPKWCVDLFPGRDKLKVINIDNAREPIYLVQKINKPLASRYKSIVAKIRETLGEYDLHR